MPLASAPLSRLELLQEVERLLIANKALSESLTKREEALEQQQVKIIKLNRSLDELKEHFKKIWDIVKAYQI